MVKIRRGTEDKDKDKDKDKGKGEGPEKGIEKLVRALTDPIVTHPRYEEIPEQLREEVPLARMAQNLKTRYDEEIREATDLEALIYCYTASLAQPLSELGAHIYGYLFNRYAEQRGIDIPEDLKDYSELSDYDQGELKRFKTWIQEQKDRCYRERVKGSYSYSSIESEGEGDEEGYGEKLSKYMKGLFEDLKY